MLLGHKKTQGDEKNWSIILNPLRNELDKKRVAQKISEAFSLSPEEASDLVANTPIILLDNLTRNDAVSVKHYFQSTGAEIMLTNDLFLKRKCYRTVWPDPPSLSFLEGWQAAKQERDPMPAEELAVDEALQEIQSLASNPALAGKAPVHEEKESFSPLPQDERERLIREADRWKREGISHQAEAARLRQEIDHLRREFDRIQKERTAAERAHTSQDDAARQREKETHDLQALLSNAEEKYEGLKEEYRQVRILMDAKLAQASRRAEEETAKNTEAAEKIETLDRTRKELEQALGQQRDKYQTLGRETEALKTAFQEEKSQKSKIEERFKDLEKNLSRLSQDLDERSREARQWELRTLDLEKGLSEARHACEEHERVIEGKNKIIESKDREHESMRRQLREINQQLEQREAVQKRIQLMGQLAEKEAQLKKLVGDQEKIEVEIRSREEGMRAILAGQEALEKEIIEAKQTERHLMEQIKNQKSPRFSASGGKTMNGKNDAAIFQPAGDGEAAD